MAVGSSALSALSMGTRLLPGAREAQPIVAVGEIGFDSPFFVRAGEEKTAADADGSAGDDVVRMMFIGLHSAIGYERSEGIGGNAVFPTIAFAQKLSRRKGD